MLDNIGQSVGKYGTNFRGDVLIVQRLLNKQSIPGASGCLIEDGIAGKNTITRIELFQKDIVKMIRPDGRIDPHGKSLKLLRTAQPIPNPRIKSTKILTLSTKAKNLLKAIEQLVLNPYDDQSGKKISAWISGATIGFGHLISYEEWTRFESGITEADANVLFELDLSPFIRCVKSRIKVELTQYEFDALVILAFNIGEAAFSTSSVLKLINNPEAITPYSSLEMAWKTWNISNKRVNRGLINRRQAEWNIYTKNIYKQW